MEQKRKIKSLLPQKFDWKSLFLTELLLFLSIVMCVLSVSLMTSRVDAQRSYTNTTPTAYTASAVTTSAMSMTSMVAEGRYYDLFGLDYTGIDNEVEVIYAMRFLDPGNLTEIVNNIYMSGNSLYISPNPVVVHSKDYMDQPSISDDDTDNKVGSGVYAHVLGGKNNKVYSNNVTLIAGRDNVVTSGNDNAAILGGVGNRFGPGKPGGVPMVIIGGSGNVMGTGHDGNALIGGENNRIGENSSRVYIFGGENNDVGDNVDNVMVGGANVTVSGVNNIFVYSTYGNFSPLSSNAFYLNLLKGVGIGVDSDYFGMAVKGAVSFGEIDINTVRCNRYNSGIVGSYQGCLVGCTNVSRLNSDGKWSLLDIGDKCLNMCANNSHCFLGNGSSLIEYGGRCGVNAGLSAEDFELQIYNDSMAHMGDPAGPRGVMGDIPDEGDGDDDIGGGDDDTGDGGDGNSPSGRNPIRNNSSQDPISSVVNGSVQPGVVGTAAVVAERTGYASIRWGEEPYGHCTKGVVNVENAYRCDGTGAETLYANSVVFETSLIDSDVKCPSGENKCVYKCKTGYHLFEVSNAFKYECRPDCVMNWADDEPQTFRYREETTGFKYGEVDCANASGENSNKCGTYKKVLVCGYDGKMYIKGSTTRANGYYKNCAMKNYRCGSDYNLSADDISSRYNETISTSNLIDRGEVVGTRGRYGVCMDYDGNGESCTIGGSHFKFKGCKAGYTLIGGKCMQNCTWEENGDTKHGSGRVFYKSGSATCPDVCSSKTFTCNDGIWTGNDKASYNITSCIVHSKKCDTGYYNVTSTIHEQYSGTSVYTGCISMDPSADTCSNSRVDYKLVNCRPGYHTEDSKYCKRNENRGACPNLPDNSHWKVEGGSFFGVSFSGGKYAVVWTGTWNTGEWINNMEEACYWECDEGYRQNGSQCEKISPDCKNTHFDCVDPHATVTGTGENEGQYYWRCQGEPCRECKDGYHLTGGNCAKNIVGRCNNDEKYGCLSGYKEERGETDLQFDWVCKGEPESMGYDDTCHFCKTDANAIWSGGAGKCVCKKGYALSGNTCVTLQPKCGNTEGECIVGTVSGHDSSAKTWYCDNGSSSVKCGIECDCPKGYRWDGKRCELYLRICAVPRDGTYVRNICSLPFAGDGGISYGNGGSPDSCCGIGWDNFSSLFTYGSINWGYNGYPKEDTRNWVCNVEGTMIFRPAAGGYLQMYLLDDWLDNGAYSCETSYPIESIFNDCYNYLEPYPEGVNNDNGYIITNCGGASETVPGEVDPCSNSCKVIEK